jgi:murein L,D-transpeptidase YafK
MKLRFQILGLLLWTLATVLAVAAFSIPAGAPPQSPEAVQVVDRIVVVKSTRTMALESNGHVLKTYKVALGRHPVGAKEREGDHRTPEGEYVVDVKNAHSRFYLALHLSYPNAADRARAQKFGANPGGDVEIHGLGRAFGWIGTRHRWLDWTDGCVAVTNQEIEEIFRMVPVGTRVELKP